MQDRTQHSITKRTAICTWCGIFPRKRIKPGNVNVFKISSNIVKQNSLTKKQRGCLSWTDTWFQYDAYTFPGYKETPLRATAHT